MIFESQGLEVDQEAKGEEINGRHGGLLAASFVLVVEGMENMAFLGLASNLVLHVQREMHFAPSTSATTVTNFMGTAFFLALLGGFLSDAYFPASRVFLLSALLDFLGFVILTVQALKASLEPPVCPPSPCQQPTTSQSAILFAGLYLVALGVGGIKGSLPTHGAHQFDESTPNGRLQRSTFFNYFVFSLSAGGLIAVTFLVWVQDHKGWKWGAFISALIILLSLPVFCAGYPYYTHKLPTGSPLTTISKVIMAATLHSCIRQRDTMPNQCRLRCSSTEVEEVKRVVKILPIFGSTIILNCCLAQLSTLSVQQAASMDTHLGSLTIPPASLPVFPILITMFLAPLYDHIILPFARKLTRTESGISDLQRIGLGLLLSVVAMGVAAVVEVKRKQVATEQGMLDSTGPLPVTFFWIAFQYALLGSADLFTLGGMLEFFFTEAPVKMRSIAMSLSWASLAVGYYMSSVIVWAVNAATGREGRKGWLEGPNLNYYRLDSFYWVLCGLGALNFLNYLFWAKRYKYTQHK